MVIVLDDLYGLPVTSGGVQCSSLVFQSLVSGRNVFYCAALITAGRSSLF